MDKLVKMINEIINNGFKNVDFYSLQLDYHIDNNSVYDLLVLDILEYENYYTTHISIDTVGGNRYDWDYEVDLNRLIENKFKLNLHHFPTIESNETLECMNYEIR